jgi:DHA1 family bicyclomycin/chloramphenicol resistance-like MFS transporter
LASFATLLADRAFVGYALVSGFVTGAMFAYISGSPFVLEDIFGVSPQIFSAIFAVNAAGIVVMSQLSSALVARVGPRRLLWSGVSCSMLRTSRAAQAGSWVWCSS